MAQETLSRSLSPREEASVSLGASTSGRPCGMGRARRAARQAGRGTAATTRVRVQRESTGRGPRSALLRLRGRQGVGRVWSRAKRGEKGGGWGGRAGCWPRARGLAGGGGDARRARYSNSARGLAALPQRTARAPAAALLRGRPALPPAGERPHPAQPSHARPRQPARTTRTPQTHPPNLFQQSVRLIPSPSSHPSHIPPVAIFSPPPSRPAPSLPRPTHPPLVLPFPSRGTTTGRRVARLRAYHRPQPGRPPSLIPSAGVDGSLAVPWSAPVRQQRRCCLGRVRGM